MKKFSLPFCVLLILFSQSCQLLKSEKAKPVEVSFSYDNKAFVLNPIAEYCFYDEKIPAEAEVLQLVKTLNDFGGASSSEVKFLLQKCDEKQNFFNGNQPRFRNTVMISLALPRYLKELKEHDLERNRETYVKFSDQIFATENLQSLNKFMKKALPKVRAKTNLKILNSLKNLNAAQKAELKLVHNELLGKESHVFLSFRSKKESGIAAYNYEAARVGKITTKCANANTLINYAPFEISICEEGEGEDWSDLESRISDYVRELISLNGDE